MVIYWICLMGDDGMATQMKRFDDRPLKWCTDCLLADEEYRFNYGVTAPMSEICPNCKVYNGDVE